MIGNPLIKLVSCVFELFSSHLSSEKVLKFLSNAYVDADSYAEFENFVYETGINYSNFIKDYEVRTQDLAKKKRIENNLKYIKKI